MPLARGQRRLCNEAIQGKTEVEAQIAQLVQMIREKLPAHDSPESAERAVLLAVETIT